MYTCSLLIPGGMSQFSLSFTGAMSQFSLSFTSIVRLSHSKVATNLPSRQRVAVLHGSTYHLGEGSEPQHDAITYRCSQHVKVTE